MDLLGLARAVGGGLLLFVLPGLAWALAARPALRRDPAALAFWAPVASAALLVLYGTALAALGRFRAGWIVAAALALAAAGAAVAWARRDAAREEPDPAAEGRARIAAVRDVTLAGDDAEKRRLEEQARRDLYG